MKEGAKWPRGWRFSLDTALTQKTYTFLSFKKDVAHLLEVRKIIEIGAVASAALHRTEDDIQIMMQILDEMKYAQGDGELGEKMDFQFHSAISTASQNPLLATLLDHVSSLMIETMRETR